MMLLTMAQLARELDVDRRQVYQWNKRRDRNGFPAPAKKMAVPYRREPVDVWYLADVKDWHKQYDATAWPKRPRKNLR